MQGLDAPQHGSKISELLASDRLARATDFFTSQAAAITEEQVRVCSIPSPPFGEAARAEWLRDRFRELGLAETTIDLEGNCLGLFKGESLRPLLVVSAHLDTVFPADTDFTVSHRNEKLFCPGIADDGCGLAALTAIAEALKMAHFKTAGSILFVGTVGEEGEGDLRGVRYLFSHGHWKNKIDMFISFDGAGLDRVTNAAIGSLRYRVTAKGPGGHSWGDFGIANPITLLGNAISRLAAYPAPSKPRTTFNVGRISGGTGTNVIPSIASMDVDLRSESERELRRLDAFFRRAMRESVEHENASRRNSNATVEAEIEGIGNRPLGETAADSMIVRLAEEATLAIGITPKLDRSSTDANLPISLGIPAVTLGAGGSSGNTHTLDEWYDPRGRHLGLQRGLLLILALAGAVNC